MIKAYFKVFSRFLSVGLAATAIHAFLYALLIHFLGTYPQLANLAGYLCAVSFSYILQMKWTFSDRSSDVNLKSLSKFLSASLSGFLLNAAFVFIVDDLLKVNSLFALLGIIFITPALTFILLNFWVFPAQAKKSPKA